MAKFLVLGDIHNEYKFFMDASVYAEQNDLHIISVGDVVDYGPHATSTIALASTLSKTGKATFIEGNHDLSLIHISEPTRLRRFAYAGVGVKKK